MKIQHKLGLDIYYLIEPNYIKYNSIYGYLVGTGGKIFFIYEINGELFSDNLTDDFNIL